MPPCSPKGVIVVRSYHYLNLDYNATILEESSILYEVPFYVQIGAIEYLIYGGLLVSYFRVEIAADYIKKVLKAIIADRFLFEIDSYIDVYFLAITFSINFVCYPNSNYESNQFYRKNTTLLMKTLYICHLHFCIICVLYIHINSRFGSIRITRIIFTKTFN